MDTSGGFADWTKEGPVAFSSVQSPGGGGWADFSTFPSPLNDLTEVRDVDGGLKGASPSNQERDTTGYRNLSASSASDDGEDSAPLDVGSVNIQLNPEQNSDSSDENNSSDSDDERHANGSYTLNTSTDSQDLPLIQNSPSPSSEVASSQKSSSDPVSSESLNLVRHDVQEAKTEGSNPSIVQILPTRTENGSEMADDDLTGNYDFLSKQGMLSKGDAAPVANHSDRGKVEEIRAEAQKACLSYDQEVLKIQNS